MKFGGVMGGRVIRVIRVRNKQTNKQTNVTHIHGPVAAVNAHTLKASGSVTQLVSQLL